MANMYEGVGNTIRFGRELGMDVNEDVRRSRGLVNPSWANEVFAGLRLARHDSQAFVPINDGGGASYEYAQIDYILPSTTDRIIASRVVARILGGKRTELAYWTQQAPTQELLIHRGLGSLMIGRPGDAVTNTYPLDAEVTKVMSVEPGRFYAITAAQETPEPLVVSCFYEGELDWDASEITVQPGQQTIEAPEGRIPVPEHFQN